MMVVVFDDDEVFFGDDEFFAIDGSENIWFEDILRWPGGVEFGFQEDKTVHMFTNEIDVVRDEQDREPEVPMQAFNEFEHAVLRGDVDARGGLVEQQDFRLLCEGPRNEDALLLAAGEMPEGGSGVILHLDILKRCHRQRAVGFAGSTEQPQAPISSHHDGLKHRDREIPIDHTLLWEVADAGAVVAAELGAGTIKNLQFPAAWRHQAEYGATHGGLA